MMPLKEEFEIADRGDLLKAIQNYGGHQLIAERLGSPISGKKLATGLTLPI